MLTTLEKTLTQPPPENPTELEERIHALDPAAFFVAPRVLRRVIVHDCLLKSLSIQAPHHPCYIIAHDALLDLVARDELRPGPRPIPEGVMLLEAVEQERYETESPAGIFLAAQRLLFQARVHAAYRRLIDVRALPPHLIRRRIDEIGQTEFDEIRLVLRQEDLVLPPRDLRANYVEFVATFLDQYFFDPAAIAVFFPALAENAARVVETISQDIDVEVCLSELPAAQSHDPAVEGDSDTNGQAAERQAPESASASERLSIQSGTQAAAKTVEESPLSPRKIRRLIRKAAKAENVGNNVRAAICHWRLCQSEERQGSALIPPESRKRAESNIDTLCRRLQTAIGFDDAEAEKWREGLLALLQATDQFIWPHEARLLYDLQKVCVDTEREIFTVDLTGWVTAWVNRVWLFARRGGVKLAVVGWRGLKGLWQGILLLGPAIFFLWRWVRREPQPEKPAASTEPRAEFTNIETAKKRRFRYPRIPRLRRTLPAQREVLMCKHLRTAEKRLAPSRIGDETRENLSELLHTATRAAENAMRDKLRGRLEGVLDRIGIQGRNLPERVSRQKLVEELLDKIASRGFLVIGDLRDAIARNRAKLPDLSGFEEFFEGDQLLQINRRLTKSLDGVYRPAEVYLRWLQRISSLAFANRVGRFATRFVALPFGGAYVILAGLQYLVHEISGSQRSMTTPALITLLGIFLLAVINSRQMRFLVRRAQRLFRRGFGMLVSLLVDALGMPVVRKVLRSHGFRWFVRWLAKPLLVTVATCLILMLSGVSWAILGWIAAGTFLVANIALNSRSGRDLEEATSEYFVRGWRSFRVIVIAGLFQWIADWSKRILNAIDRVLYTADEWLRFRRGETRMTILVKAVVGAVWSVVRYVVRFAVNLLIEPQINPIKHFPVVTVAHKLLFALIPSASGLLVKYFGYSNAEAAAIVGSVIWLIPGIFGFMAWELKENWRLYRANQPLSLRPLIVGHHGESMVRIVRPGFHSGTLPKAFKKLRKARKKALAKGNPALVRKAEEHVAELKHLIHDVVERELVNLLDACGSWPYQLSVGRIELSTNRIFIELRCAEWPDETAVIAMEDQSGKLLAGVAKAGWSARMDHVHRLMLRNALLGFYKVCGVMMIRQQIDACFPEHDFRYDIDERGLALWPTGNFETEVVYDFSHGPELHPMLVSGITPAALPTLTIGELFLTEATLPWWSWVEYWEQCTQGQCPTKRILSEFRVLPAVRPGDANSPQPLIAPL